MVEKNITYQSSTIFYRVAGSGKPVLLLHGFGEDGAIWNKQIDFLSAPGAQWAGLGGKPEFQLIIPDVPGSGKSAMIEDMSMEGMAEVVKEIITVEQQNFPTAGISMIGHSMGGYITLAFAEKYPHLLNSLGLFHSSAFADNDEKKAARLKSIDFIKNNGAYEFLKTSIPGLFHKGQDGLEPSDPLKLEIDALVEKGKNFSPEALIAYYQAMIARPDRTAVLKNFPHPVLFILGEHDKAIPIAQGLQQSYMPNLSHIHILRKSAHMGMWEETGKANAALLEFLQGQPQ